MIREGQLILSDGSTFEGELLGAYPPNGIATGEVVFNTAMSGYQEIITDPSYAGQIITFTYPHIGNYGTNTMDTESAGAFCRGIVIRDLARRPSNFRNAEDLDSMLGRLAIPAIAGIDTRRLTKLLRETGAMIGAFGDAEADDLRAAIEREPGTDGVDLVATVTTDHPYRVDAAGGAPDRLIVAYDFGIKTMIVRQLAHLGTVQVVPASTPASEVLAMQPDGVFLSNGPGDPRILTDTIEQVRTLIGAVPVFGICLGFQLLGLAAGAKVTKMAFGHHGANHPVKRLTTDEVEITSQNHNFAIDADSFAGLSDTVVATHTNLNDGVCEGLEVVGKWCFGVQHHPEAGPGPHDSNYLFGLFDEMMSQAPTRRPAMAASPGDPSPFAAPTTDTMADTSMADASTTDNCMADAGPTTSPAGTPETSVEVNAAASDDNLAPPDPQSVTAPIARMDPADLPRPNAHDRRGGR